jgi:hypothetical protein
MSDLIKRLRGWPGPRGGEVPYVETMAEAADEIEKLRAALRGVLTYYNAPTPAEAKLKKAVLATPIEQARTALGEEE